MILAPITIAIHTFGRDTRQDLVDDVRSGLARTPKALPPRWFYDERGSRLFDAITELPEYYLTHAETSILRERAADIVAAVQPEAIVELGAGTSTKTRILIEAAMREGLSWFVPLDISEEVLQESARRLATDFPGLRVYAIVGDFAAHLDRVPRCGRQLLAFLGSTIGNLDDRQRSSFLHRVRRLLAPGDAFLLGVDLVKPEPELIAAYDDAQGVTAEFNRNLLRVLNRELGADFDLDAFEHVAVFDRERSRMELSLRATRAQHVRLPGAGLSVDFAAGELMQTEISVKFTRESVERSLRDSGMAVFHWFTDSGERFALCLCVPA